MNLTTNNVDGINTKLPQLPEATKFAYLALIGSVYFVWMSYADVHFGDTFRTLVVIVVQVIIGLLITRRVFVKTLFSSFESIGIGLSIGSLVCTTIDQVILATGLDISIWFCQGLLILGLMAPSRRSNAPLFPVPNSVDFRFLLASPLFIMSGFGVFTRGWWVAAAMLVLTQVAATYPKISTSEMLKFGTLCSGFLAWIILLFAFKPSTSPYGEWFLRPLYTGSDDLVFSESMAFSLSKFGIHDYAAAVGTPIRYHWFSLAWSGLIDKASMASPFVVTLHVVPVVVFVAIPALVVSLLRLTRIRGVTGVFALCILFGTATTIEPHRFFHVLNTSNVVPFIWLLLTAVALVVHGSCELRFPLVVIPLLISATFLAKAPFGIAAISGTASLLMYFCIARRESHQLVLLIASFLAALFSYILFLSPHSWEQRRFLVTWNFAHLATDTILYPLAPILLIFIVLATLHIGILGLAIERPGPTTFPIYIFLAGASSTGLLRFVVSGGSAEFYFFNVTIVCGALISGLSLEIVMTRSQALPSFFEALTVVAFSLAAMTFEIHSGLIAKTTSRSTSDIVAPILIAQACLVTISALRFFMKRSKLSMKPFIFALSTLSASSAFLLSTFSSPERYVSTTQVASVEDLAALNWLRESSPSDSIVATNRFLCPSMEPCSFDDSSYLVSAVARRKVLVEGPRFVIGGRPYPEWIMERILLSTRFAETPNEADLHTLQSFGVGWFILDEEFLNDSTFKESDWTEYGSLSYHKDGVAIIKLASK